jgi:ribose transport system substrate-binding protein
MTRSSFRSKALGVAVVMAMSLTMAACGTSNSSSAGPTSADAPLKGKTILYVETGAIPYYEYTKQGIVAAVKALGGQAKVVNSNFDAGTELSNIQNAITEKVDGVVLEPLSSATVKAELRLLDAAKIPTSVLYGYSDDVRNEAVAFHEAQNLVTTEVIGKTLRKLVPTGDVAIITGTQGRAEVDRANVGFEKGFGDNSRIVEVYNGDYNRKTAYSVTQDLLTKHPDIAGIFVHNEDMAIGTIEALGSKASSIAIVTQNGSPDGVKYLKAGEIKASVGWSPTQEGAMAVESLALYFQGTPRPQKLCLTPYAVNTPEHPEASARWDDIAGVVKHGLETKCAAGSN